MSNVYKIENLEIPKDNFGKQINQTFEKLKKYTGKVVKAKQKKLFDNLKIILENYDIENQHIYSSIHEIRLYDFLMRENIPIEMHSDDKSGPDFECDFGYIECVSITKGDGKNKSYYEDIINGTMNRYMAGESRISSAIYEKKEKYDKYIKGNVVNLGKPRIIAISTSILSNEVHHELSSELLQKILYGIGCQVVRVKKEGLKTEFGEIYYNYDSTVKKPATEFNTAYFFTKEFNDISAVILNHNAFTEDINNEYCEIYLNPNAIVPVDIQKIQKFKYFYMQINNGSEAIFNWHNH